MALLDRGVWNNSPSIKTNIKKDRQWKTAGAKIDTSVDPLDSLDMEDDGLFILTLKQNKIPFEGKF